MDRSKILSMVVENLHFLHVELFTCGSKKNAEIDLRCKKGYYPHFFNTASSLNYVGSYPEPEFYGADFVRV